MSERVAQHSGRPQRASRAYRRLTGAFACAAIGLCASVAAAAEPPAQPDPAEALPALDPSAAAVYRRFASYLQSLPAFRVKADTTHEKVVGNGFKLQKAEVIDLLVSQPGRMRAEVSGDERQQLVLDDGRSLTIYSKPEKYYAKMTALPTLEDTLDVAFSKYGVEGPILDLIDIAAGKDLAKNVVASRLIGVSRVDGVPCDHIAFRAKDLDWQIWVERGDKPLLRKVVITTRNEPGAPEYTAKFEWDTSPVVRDDLFAFTPPPGASEMAFPKPQNKPPAPAAHPTEGQP